MSRRGGGGSERSGFRRAEEREEGKLREEGSENWVVPGKMRRGFHVNLGLSTSQKLLVKCRKYIRNNDLSLVTSCGVLATCRQPCRQKFKARSRPKE
jgi:hypothetical protein